METLKGRSASGGIVRARIVYFDRSAAAPVRAEANAGPNAGARRDPDAELARFAAARDEAASQLLALHAKAVAEIGEEEAAIFEIGALMLRDDDFVACVEQAAREKGLSAELAVEEASAEFAEQLKATGDPYLAARAADVRDACGRVAALLSGSARAAPVLDCPSILAADDLLPSETVALDRKLLLGIATSGGSANAHTAILARALGIPAVVGLGPALGPDSDGREAVLDGGAGVLVLDPDAEASRGAEEAAARAAEGMAALEGLRGLDNVTRGGRRVDVYANAGSQADVLAALDNDTGGIGLLRSEFLYLEKGDYPTEDELFASYRAAAEAMGGRRVVVRTLDIGADKSAPYFGLAAEENPALGLRAVRLCLARPALFRTQLRAVLRASAHGKVSVMFPMVASVADVRACLAALDAARAELEAEGLPFDRNMEKGIMVETPAAALVAEDLAPLVDFFSVGTNDLAQYALAADRMNGEVAGYYDQAHPAVLKLIGMAARAAKAAGIWIGVCGELAADPRATGTLLDLGVDELSVSPAAVLPLRARVRELD